MTNKHVSRGNGKSAGRAAGTAARTRGRAGRRARRAGQSMRARRAAAQLAPLALSARMTAVQRVYGARVWAAPRLERMGQTLQERVAPRMSAMLSATARRIDPAPPRRRRWPVLAAGIVMIAGGGAAAALLLNRRGPGSIADLARPGGGRPSAAQPDMTGAETADVNGHMQAP